MEVKIEVIPNYELEKLVLSFGGEVKVIDPVGLLWRVQKGLKEAIELYKKI